MKGETRSRTTDVRCTSISERAANRSSKIKRYRQKGARRHKTGLAGPLQNYLPCTASSENEGYRESQVKGGDVPITAWVVLKTQSA